MLEKHSGYDPIFEADSGDEGFRIARERRPDLVIMDISLPDMNGIELTTKLRKELPGTQVVILSMHIKVDYVSKAFQAGALGYVLKESATDNLFQCLEAASRGSYFIDPPLHQAVAEKLIKSREPRERSADSDYGTLTQREQEILRLLAEGHSSKEIAEHLFLSQKTVENHRGNIMRKLDLHSTVELIRYAAKFGLIELDHWRK